MAVARSATNPDEESQACTPKVIGVVDTLVPVTVNLAPSDMYLRYIFDQKSNHYG